MLQISYKDNKDGTVSVNYLPTAPGEYKISVRFGDKNIKGSPFFSKVNFKISNLSSLNCLQNNLFYFIIINYYLGYW